jgi:hypothetical protein
MRTALRDSIRDGALILAFVFLPSLLSSQSTQPPPTTALPEDNLSPAEFTTILKEAWTFLKDENDSFTRAVGKKAEFETTAEFEKHTIEARKQYLTKITKFAKDKKFDQRVIGVLLKANLDQYDADNQVYDVSCPNLIDAPYNLPTMSTEIPSNTYVALADSIKKGYRTSSIHLKFSPYFRWQVARDIAQTAKSGEADIFFKVRFKIDLNQASVSKGARFVVIPKQVLFFNQKSNAVYWEQTLR